MEKEAWTKEMVIAQLDKYQSAVEKSLVVIFNRQTADEQRVNETHDLNGRGFSGADAEFGSSLAKQILAGRHLSEKQLQYGRKMAKKYAQQVADEANEVLGVEPKRKRKRNTPTKQTDAWSDSEGGVRTIEVSTLNRLDGSKDDSFLCPTCSSVIPWKGCKANCDKEDGDCTHWETFCGRCKATLLIFND